MCGLRVAISGFVDTAESDGREVAGFVAVSSGGVMAVMMSVVRVLS